jgi:hypothetical protein
MNLVSSTGGMQMSKNASGLSSFQRSNRQAEVTVAHLCSKLDRSKVMKKCCKMN